MTNKEKRLEEAKKVINDVLKSVLDVEEVSLLAEYIFSKEPIIMEGNNRQSKFIILELPLMEYKQLQYCYDNSKRNWKEEINGK